MLGVGNHQCVQEPLTKSVGDVQDALKGYRWWGGGIPVAPVVERKVEKAHGSLAVPVRDLLFTCQAITSQGNILSLGVCF